MPFAYNAYAGMDEFLANQRYAPKRAAFSGKGAQSKAREVGPWVLQIDPKDGGGYFYGYPTEAERDDHAAELCAAGHDVNERVDGQRPCRPFIDFDGDSSVSDADIELVREVVREQLTELGAADDSIATFGYDLASKRSRHIIAQGALLPDGLAARRFAEDVRDALPERMRGFIDRLGGLSSFGLRLPYCLKSGDEARVLRQDASEEPGEWYLQTEADIPVIGEVSLPAEKPAMPAMDISCVRARNISTITERVAKEMPWLLAPAEHCVQGRDDIVAVFERAYRSLCPGCKREHDRRGAYLSVDADGIAYLHCYAAEKGTRPLMTAGACTRVVPSDEFDEMSAARAERVDTRYNADGIDDDGASDYYIGSAWGTGKSFHNAQIVRSLREKTPTARVLIVSARRSLSAQLAADFGASLYTNIKGMLDPKRHPVSVWQLESLKRVDASTIFDLIVVDEVTALAEHSYGLEFNKSARASMSTLRHLVKAAGRVLVTDNDLTGYQVDAFRKLRAGKPARVIRNDHQPWKGVPVEIVRGRKGAKAHEHVVARIFARCDEQWALRQNGQDWTGCVVPCHSRKRADAIAKEARARYGSEVVRLYTGESDDHVKQRDFADAAAAWAGALLVIYTGTVSVGVSAALPHLTHVFACFIGGNATASASAQMLFRARCVKSIVVAFDGGDFKGLPQLRDELFAWAVTAKNRGSIPDEFRHDRSPVIDEPSACDADALAKVADRFEGRLWTNTTIGVYRSRADFVGRLVAILSRAGLDARLQTETTGVVQTAPAPVSGEAPLPEREVVMAEQVVAVVEALVDNPTKYDPESNTPLSYEEKAGLRTVRLAQVFGVDPLALQGRDDWIAHYEGHAATFDSLRRVCVGVERGCVDEAPAVRSEREAGALVRRTFEALGVKLDNVDCPALSAKKITEAAMCVGDEINSHALRLFDDRNGARRKKGGARTHRPTIECALAFVGARLVPVYRTKSDAAKRVAGSYELRWAWNAIDNPKGLAWEAELRPQHYPRPSHPVDRMVEFAAIDPLDEVYGV
jgi:hypothetical protein